MDWLNSFDSFLAEAEVHSDMNGPATLERILQLEADLEMQERIRGFKVPPAYKAFLLRWDGGSIDEEEGAEAHVHFLSVAEEKKYGYSLMNYNGADTVFMNHEIDTYFDFEPLVIFAMDEGSNFWAFDPRHKRSDGEMPIRYCDHECGDIYAQSDDFASFILSLAHHKLEYRSLEDPVRSGTLRR